jgi:CRISPR-associated endonuclease Csn1
MPDSKNSLLLVGPDRPLTKLPKHFPRVIDEALTLGIDIGIGSCGLALIHHSEKDKPIIRGFSEMPDRISFLGVRTFDVPETKEKTGPKLKNPERRQARLLRRGIARRAQRMRYIRILLKAEGLLPTDYSVDSQEWKKQHEAATPWEWRVEALENKLDPWSWAAVLIHFAKHRGFRSNRKSDLASKGEKGGTLESSKANHEALAHYRTLGEMFVNDSRFAERKRNRDGSYTAMILRGDLIAEIDELFEKQRNLGNPHASATFQAEYIKTLQTQRPLQNPIALLEDCPFEASEKRGTRHSPSFELSRALQKLNTLTLKSTNGSELAFPEFVKHQPNAYATFISQFGTSKKVSWKQLRKIFSIADDISFANLSITHRATTKKPSKKIAEGPEIKADTAPKSISVLEGEDFVNRGAKGCAESTALFRSLLGEDDWHQVTRESYQILDEAAFALTFYEVLEDEDSDRTILGVIHATCHSQPKLVQAIVQDLKESDKPTLHNFKGSVAVSMKVSRSIIPHLAEGLVYSAAMDAAGYTHTDSSISLKSITNPIVKSVVRETMKQIIHLIDEAGRIPGKINVELARDLGKSMDERNEISRGLDKRTTERNTHREQAAQLLGIAPASVSDEDLLKYEMRREQGGFCVYSGEQLPAGKELFTAVLQIDHILPRSRSHDNSYDNKVLVFTATNQDKKNQTPYEWLGGPTDQRWQDHVTRISSMRGIRGRKRRNLLDSTFGQREDEFLARNLNDTRYIGRLITAFLQDIYTIIGEKPPTVKDSKRRIFVRPGALTAMIRKAWGLEDLKKDLAGNRIGDKHHAVDALICACIGEGQSQFITALSKAWGDMEKLHAYSLIPRHLAPPWKGFRQSVVTALDLVHVSRREDCGGKGSVHDDTVYGRDKDGTSWKRSALIASDGNKKATFLTQLSQLEEIRGAREIDTRNKWLRPALTAWIEAGSPLDQPPLDNRGKVINKLFRQTSGNSLRQIDRGWVSNGNMIRCDVFSKGGKYALIPVYSHQLSSTEPPLKFISANKPESEWKSVDETYQFEFSLWKNSRFQVNERAKKGAAVGLIITGCYAGLDRSVGKISYNLPNDHGADSLRIAPMTSLKFQKLLIDRLGRVFPIPKEKRTWRGKVCI